MENTFFTFYLRAVKRTTMGVSMNEKVKINIGGDIVQTKSNLVDFESDDIRGIISGDLFVLLQMADCRIFILETPVIDKETPIEKEGDCFRTSIKSLTGIKRLNINLITFVNKLL